VDYFHYVSHGAEGVAFLYNMLRKLRSIVCIFVIIVVLAESYPEGTSNLAHIPLVASRAL
jgi:hypothetical protein